MNSLFQECGIELVEIPLHDDEDGLEMVWDAQRGHGVDGEGEALEGGEDVDDGALRLSVAEVKRHRRAADGVARRVVADRDALVVLQPGEAHAAPAELADDGARAQRVGAHLVAGQPRAVVLVALEALDAHAEREDEVEARAVEVQKVDHPRPQCPRELQLRRALSPGGVSQKRRDGSWY